MGACSQRLLCTCPPPTVFCLEAQSPPPDNLCIPLSSLIPTDECSRLSYRNTRRCERHSMLCLNAFFSGGLAFQVSLWRPHSSLPLFPGCPCWCHTNPQLSPETPLLWRWEGKASSSFLWHCGPNPGVIYIPPSVITPLGSGKMASVLGASPLSILKAVDAVVLCYIAPEINCLWRNILFSTQLPLAMSH